MQRRLIVWFAVFAAALLVVASPASAATAIVSLNTTDSDFDAATEQTDFVTVGSGSDASIQSTGVVDDFSDGDSLTSDGAAWGDWEGDTAALTAAGALEAGENFQLVYVDREAETGSPIRTAQPLSWTMETTTASQAVPDYARVDIRQFGQTLVRIDAKNTGGSTALFINDTQVASKPGEDDVQWDITVQWDFANNEATVFVDGVNEGTFGFFDGNTASGWTRFFASVSPSGAAGDPNIIKLSGVYEGAFVGDGSTVWDASYIGALHDGSATAGVVDIDTLSGGTATLEWQGSDDGQNWTTVDTQTVTSAGWKNSSLSGQFDEYRLKARFEKDSRTDVFSIGAEGIESSVSSPIITNPDPADGSNISSYDGDVSISVSDGDFGDAEGDSLSVELENQNGDAGSLTLDANGSATISYSAVAGSNDLTWTVTDSYGQSTTVGQSFQIPAKLFLRQETNTSQLVTSSSNLTLRFFGGDVIVEREAENGSVDMTGLPATEEIVVVARADGYYSRRAVLGSLYEQQSIYMLSENESAVFNEFVIDDRVGLFSSNQTKIRLEKGITQNGSTEWKTLTGDYLGAGRSFSVTLQQDARYRVYVENQQGDVRNVGPHIATADGVVPVPIGQIVWEAPKGDTYKWKSSLDEDSNTLQFEFVDPADETMNFEVKAYVKGNEANPIFEDSQASLGTYQATTMLTENETKQQIIVEWSADRNGEEIGETNRAGAVGEWDVPVDQRWLTSGALLFLVAITWLIPSAMSRVGSVMVVAVAFGLSSLGIVPIPLAVIGISGATALLGLAAEFRR